MVEIAFVRILKINLNIIFTSTFKKYKMLDFLGKLLSICKIGRFTETKDFSAYLALSDMYLDNLVTWRLYVEALFAHIISQVTSFVVVSKTFPSRL